MQTRNLSSWKLIKFTETSGVKLLSTFQEGQTIPPRITSILLYVPKSKESRNSKYQMKFIVTSKSASRLST
jgi:hypothetical protein